jgi:hypothetical protein
VHVSRGCKFGSKTKIEAVFCEFVPLVLTDTDRLNNLFDMAGYSAAPIDLTLEDDGPGAISNAFYSRFEATPFSSGPLNRPFMRPTLK